MSTDGPARARRRPADRFRRRFVAVVVVLAVAAGVAAAAGSQQGPRLRDVSYDATDLVSRPAQRVILTANQALERVDADDVHVRPTAPHTVTSSGNTIAVQFTGPLQYDRDYSVTIRGVRAPGQDVTADLRTTVRTGTTAVLALVPGNRGAADRIVRRSLGAGGTETVYQAPDIAEYVRLGRTLVVLRNPGVGDSAVDVVPLRGGLQDRSADVEHITLPSPRGSVTALHAADTGASFGFRYADTSTGESRDVGLYVVDMTGTHLPQPVAADGRPTIGATPMSVTQWAYVPRTERALVRTGADELLLVDTSGRQDAVRLGSATYLHGFVASGTTAVVETGRGIDRLDLTDGAHTPVSAPPGSTDASVLGRIAPLTDTTYLRVVGSVRSDGTVANRIVRVDGNRSSRLSVPIPDDADLTRVCPSPNGQFVALRLVGADGTLVSIVDATSGTLEASIAGTDIDWCSALPTGNEIG